MGFSRKLSLSLFEYLLKKKWQGCKRFPLVLMLEPLFLCNLHCAGCGRILEYKNVLDKMLSPDECIASVEEADAPVVSITGGEPLLYPQITDIVKVIISQKRFINVCTNGLLLERSLSRFKPDPHLFFVVHLDGLAVTHDRLAGKPGVFETAVSAIKKARKAGFQVLTNTTIYKQTVLEEIRQLFYLLAEIPVNGIMVAPAFDYEALNTDSFLSQQDTQKVFQSLYSLRHDVPYYNTPLYFEFLSGKLDLECKPWSTPTRNPVGWKKPCYLLTDGHCRTFRELMDNTDWSKYGAKNNPRCKNCRVHCGYEASALSAIRQSPVNLWKSLKGICL